jgi:hypothetical protein
MHSPWQPSNGAHADASRLGIARSTIDSIIHSLNRTREAEASSEARNKAQILKHLAWEILHTGPWKDVPEVWREVYSFAVLVSSLSLLSKCGNRSQPERCALTFSGILRRLDVALLVGGPVFARLIHPIISYITDDTKLVTNEQPDSVSQRLEESTVSWLAQAEPPAHFSMPLRPALTILEVIEAPDMWLFQCNYMDKLQPCLLDGVVDTWPAIQRCCF